MKGKKPVFPLPADFGVYTTGFPEPFRKASKRSMGCVLVCCKCRCTGVTLMRYGNKYICVDCVRKGKA